MIQFDFKLRFSWTGFKARFSVSDPSPLRVEPARNVSSAKPAPPVRYGGYVAGLKYYDGPEILHQFRRGMVFRMVRDRFNAHDSNAIRLMIGRHMIGYVPRGPNVEIASRMDRAEAMICRIERVRPDSRSWKQIEICIESQSIARQWWNESELDELHDETDDVFADSVSATELGFENY